MVRVDKDSLDKCEVEHGNLRAALTWLDDINDVEGLVRLAGALGECWQFRGHRREGLAWLERAISRAQGPSVPVTLRVRALHTASWLARDLGNVTRATEFANACEALAAESGNPRELALIPELRGYAALAAGDYNRAVTYANAAQEQLAAMGYAWLASAARTDLALATYGHGDLVRAAALLEETLAQFRELGDAWYPQLILVYLGLIACDLGDRATAASRFAESLRLWQEVGTRDRLAQWLAGVATLATTCGAPQLAVSLFGAAEALGDTVGLAFVLPERAVFERAEATARAALSPPTFATARDKGKALSLEQAVAEASGLLATLVAPASPQGRDDPITSSGLTPRELEVLRLLASGRTDRQIAEALFIGHRTATTHVSRVLGKIGVGSRSEATAWAVRHGVV